MGFRGYHTKVQTQLPAFERTRINEHGVYEEVITAHNTAKVVTLFPESWTEEIIRTKVAEASQKENRVNAHDQGFIGKTSEGVLIAFWYVPNNLTKEFSVIFYPLLETTVEKL